MFVECEKQFAPPNYYMRESGIYENNRLTSIESVPEVDTVEPSCLSDSLSQESHLAKQGNEKSMPHVFVIPDIDKWQKTEQQKNARTS